MNEKACTGCKEVKPLSAFGFSKRGRGRYNPRCRACSNAHSSARRATFSSRESIPVIGGAFCPGCEETLAASDFLACRSRKNGLQTYCKLCTRARRRGITKAQYLAILGAQGNKCAVCRIDLVLTGNRREVAAIDHDHETGLTRGVLCLLCNAALGLVRDDPNVLRGLLRYLGHDEGASQEEAQTA